MSSVMLIPMTDEDLQELLKTAIPDYAQDLVRAGNASLDQALETSENQFRELLPNGVASPNQHLFVISDQEKRKKVGSLWFAVEERRGRKLAFIYDLIVLPEFRRQGYGEQAMLAVEDKVKELGLDEIRLHVFGDNLGARALYQKIGYIETNINMAKHL